MAQYDSHIVRYSQGKGFNLGKAKNKSTPWKMFRGLFRIPHRTAEQFAAYMRMKPDEQLKLKAEAGWIYRTQIEGGRRNAKSGLPSDLIILDFDNATPIFLSQIIMGLVASRLEYFVHSTRRHTEEKPRLRIFVLLSRAVTNDEYGAVSRILTREHFDPSMAMVDPVSFRKAQMMFMPTCSRDGEWRFVHNEGAPLDPDALLALFAETDGDWHDMTKLPKCKGEDDLRQHADKAENPTEKDGPVGFFCRAYNIFEAMDHWIPGTYDAVDDHSSKPRYTYTKGSASSGAVVEDDGLFLYSHHGTDPCADMLVNAWDMVRLHKFADLDDAIDVKDTPMGKRPSWLAMMELVDNDPKYKREQAAARYDQESMFTDDMVDDDLEEPEAAPEFSSFDDDDAWERYAADLTGQARAESAESDGPEYTDPGAGGSAPGEGEHGDTPPPPGRKKRKKAPPPKDWHLDLEANKQGEFVSTSTNVSRILQRDPRIKDAIEFNSFRQQPVTRDRIRSKMDIVPVVEVANDIDGEPWQDIHSDIVRTILEAPNGPGKPGWGLKVTDRDLQTAINLAARQAPFHPIIELLEAQRWDGVKRVARFFSTFLGTPDDAYHREVATKWFVAAIARLYEPGHKFDFVPILEGIQGKRKSTLISILGLYWFGELKGDFSDEKKMVEAMMGHWIMELPELSGINRSEIEDVKAFVSQVSSSVRLSYGRRPEVFPRKCVFMGSTNEREYLIDHTGNRRWWPIFCAVRQIDTPRLAREVYQLWAEAIVMYRAMRAERPISTGHLPLYLEDPEAERISLLLQEGARQTTEVDLMAGEIEAWLDSPAKTDRMSEETFYRDVTCINQVWKEALGNDRGATRPQAQSVSKALQKIGWTKGKIARMGQYGPQQQWHRPEDSTYGLV